jgi:Polyketide cyclase / dehydrase and lipid transport
METDTVTGATTSVSLQVDLPVERLWTLVTDVPRYGRWSPECVHTEWLYGAGDPPRIGDRFVGRSQFPDGFVSTALCLVTEVSRPEAFAWHVLDIDDRPGSIWRYELAGDGADRTRLTHVFEHGPGRTGVRSLVKDDPARLADRLAQLRHNMTVSLAAMLDGTAYREVAAV